MIEKEQAIEIARKRAVANNWAFVEPINVVVRRGWFGKISRYELETNAGNRGTKARFVIDANSGEIISEGYISR